MSAFEKLVRKLVCKQGEITIDDIRRLAHCFDYTEWKKPGSECTFHRKGSPPLNAPTIKGRYVRRQYVKRIVRILELEEYLERFQRD